MSNDHVYRKYAAIALVAIGLAGFLAVVLGLNIHRMLKSDQPLVVKEETRKIAPQAPAPTVATTAHPDSILTQIHTAIAHEPAAVQELYAAFFDAPLWVDSPESLKKTSARLKDLKETFQIADAHGITLALPNKGFTDPAQADVALTREALRLATAFRLGAVPAAKVGDWTIAPDDFDPVPGLIGAIKNNSVAAFYKELLPADPQYRDLVDAYKGYRAIAARGGWAEIPGDEELKLDSGDARVALLRQRLAAEDYPGAKTKKLADLDGAIRTFQARHGLEPDGRIGKSTLAALNVPVDVRIKLIAANLERHRHAPRELGDTYVLVNTASTTLDFIQDGERKLHMNVVTGDKRHATPILSAKITGVTLNPRWEIPPSIAAKEILPKLKSNPRYLAENNMTIVDGVAANSTGELIDWSQYSANAFPMRLRQQPGDDNALGVLKFQMANPYNIYLHDTPSKKAFARAERHLSHGCVRLGEPMALATTVLADTTWTEESLIEAIDKGDTRTIALKTQIPVHIFYWTAYTDDGALNFREDIYNRDLPLARALGESAITTN